MSDFIKQIAKIQAKLKAPKSQFNKFGKYYYRSCEDILEGVKPLLGEFVLTVSDDVVLVGGRIYVKATATITNGTDSISNSAFARESLDKKGMDESQITGTASSYARKYALNGLLCIDDTKDADHVPPSETDISWVNAIKTNQTTLEAIEDVKYRSYIKGLL
ncbi:ERF family protein [Pseudoalteromonas sp.]|uniref:ERF family protein n=1 Tax=Pseudoalteromonas sp. TaxID=53249 RepID=UPI0035629F9F